jgi:hypothetical protein
MPGPPISRCLNFFTASWEGLGEEDRKGNSYTIKSKILSRFPSYFSDFEEAGFLTSMILRSMTFVPVGPVINRSPNFWKKE